jgi:hypothetical protein
VSSVLSSPASAHLWSEKNLSELCAELTSAHLWSEKSMCKLSAEIVQHPTQCLSLQPVQEGVDPLLLLTHQHYNIPRVILMLPCRWSRFQPNITWEVSPNIFRPTNILAVMLTSCRTEIRQSYPFKKEINHCSRISAHKLMRK